MAPIGASGEETNLIKSYILITIILDIFKRDSIAIEQAVKTPTPYLKVINTAMDKITKKMYEIRREFRHRGIKVFEIERTKEGVSAEYICRGYTSRFSMLWSLVKAESHIRMCAYMGLDISSYIKDEKPSI